MPTYTYRCPSAECEEYSLVTRSIHDIVEFAPTCGPHGTMVRDYRADMPYIAAAATPTRVQRAGAGDDWRDILPSTDDFKGPGDPDGTKGLRQWREEHEPKVPGAAHPQEKEILRSRLT